MKENSLKTFIINRSFTNSNQNKHITNKNFNSIEIWSNKNAKSSQEEALLQEYQKKSNERKNIKRKEKFVPKPRSKEYRGT